MAKKADAAYTYMVSEILSQGYSIDNISNPELVRKFTKEQADQARRVK